MNCSDCGREIVSGESYTIIDGKPKHTKGSFPDADPLSLIAEKHGTDKGPSTHGYTALYHTLFGAKREKVEKVLEIGIFKGNSLKMWSDYFPNARVVGVDINPECAKLDFSAFPRVQVIIGDAGQPRTIREVDVALGRDVDLIVDDGSHLGPDIMAAFDAYFFMLRTMGVYVIEDVNLRRSASAMWICWKTEMA